MCWSNGRSIRDRASPVKRRRGQSPVFGRMSLASAAGGGQQPRGDAVTRRPGRWAPRAGWIKCRRGPGRARPRTGSRSPKKHRRAGETAGALGQVACHGSRARRSSRMRSPSRSRSARCRAGNLFTCARGVLRAGVRGQWSVHSRHRLVECATRGIRRAGLRSGPLSVRAVSGHLSRSPSSPSAAEGPRRIG